VAGNIDNGQSKVVTFKVVINASLAGKTVTNTAVADGVPSNPVPIDIEKIPVFGLPKTGDVLSVTLPLVVIATALFFFLALSGGYRRRYRGEGRRYA